MLSGIGGEAMAVWFRPVERAAPVGPRAADPQATPAVTNAEGRSVTTAAPSLESLSREKRQLLEQLRGELASKERELLRGGGEGRDGYAAPAPQSAGTSGETSASGLTESEQAVVERLKEVDRETRAHEQAHAAVGGQFAGAPSYDYEIGPDGQRYAVGGEVKIDVSPVPGDPEATLEKMRIVERAALAPAEPSPQDRKVAQEARAQAQAASAAAAEQSAAERRGEAETGYAAAAEAVAYQPPAAGLLPGRVIAAQVRPG